MNKIPIQPASDAISLGKSTQVAYGLTIFGGKVHESITKKAAELADLTYGNLLDGVQWPDAPSDDPVKPSFLELRPKWIPGGDLHISNTITHESHYGKYQFWHSMTPDDGAGKVYTNGEVKELIIKQAIEWYEQAQSTGNTFHLGKVLHMVQDSYSHSHVMRDENGKVKNFQSYSEQDGHAHGLEDKPQIKTVIESSGIERQVMDDWQKVPGAMQALDASTQILKLYKSGASSKDLADYLRNHVYQFESECTKDMPAGGTDPKYAKPKTVITENDNKPRTPASQPTINDLPLTENSPLKAETLKEYLTLHHGSESADKILMSIQESLSASLQHINQHEGIDRG